MILSAIQIKKAINDGVWTVRRDDELIGVDDLVCGPNSLDITLGRHIHFLKPYNTSLFLGDYTCTVEPNEFLLGHTRESIDCSAPLKIRGQEWYFVPMLEGRSTLARAGVSIHQTSGFGDFSFSAQWTLEISTHLPFKLEYGQRIGQVYFMAMLTGENETPERYQGAYANQHGAQGAIIGKGRI